MSETLKIWAVGCTHAGNDIQHGHKSLHRACKDAEDFGFDFGVSLGDFSGQQGLPTDEEGAMYREQLTSGLKNHFPEDIYPLGGNHDRTDQPGILCGEWFEKWMDPAGTSPDSGMRNNLRPFPIVGGRWDAYEVHVGNLVLLFLSDVNRPTTPLRGEGSGDPGGVVTPEVYEWWKGTCEAYRDTDKMVVTFAHYLPLETTTATSEYGGGVVDSNGDYQSVYHAAGKEGGRTSSYLAYVGEDSSQAWFTEHLEQHPGDCALWVGAHNHVPSGLAVGNLPHINERFGCLFVQNGAVSKYHHRYPTMANPKSRFYEFTDDSNQLLIHAYTHETMNGFTKGNVNTKTFNLPKPFKF